MTRRDDVEYLSNWFMVRSRRLVERLKAKSDRDSQCQGKATLPRFKHDLSRQSFAKPSSTSSTRYGQAPFPIARYTRCRTHGGASQQ